MSTINIKYLSIALIASAFVISMGITGALEVFAISHDNTTTDHGNMTMGNMSDGHMTAGNATDADMMTTNMTMQ